MAGQSGFPDTASLPKVGVAFRRSMSRDDLMRAGDIQLLEVTLDGFMTPGGRRYLGKLAEDFALVTHSLSLNLASPWGPDSAYLKNVRVLLDIVEAKFHTDHLAVTNTPEYWFPQLTPPLLINGDLENAVRNVSRVQEALGRPMLLENIANFFQPYPQEELVDFMTRICNESGARLLLDVENLYANWLNFGGEEPEGLLNRMLPQHVVGLHIAGGRVDQTGFYVDAHDSCPGEPELRLAEIAAVKLAPQYAIIEFDTAVPAVTDLERLCFSWRQRIATNQVRPAIS